MGSGIKSWWGKYKKNVAGIAGIVWFFVANGGFLLALMKNVIQNPLMIWMLASLATSLPFFIFLILQNRKLDAIGYKLENYSLYSSKLPHVRYVAVRIASFQNILENVSSKDSDFPGTVKKIGEIVGESLVREVLNALPNEDNLERQINRWLEMEEFSGWGHFTAEFFNKPDKTYDIRINVTNCFLLHGKDCNQGRKLCYFLCGYMEKIIKTITRFSGCCILDCGNPSGGICRFMFKSGSSGNT